MAEFSDYLKEKYCPKLTLKLSNPLDRLITLRRPGYPLPSSYYPDWFFNKAEKRDYNRDDTKEIVNNMKPYNN